uniref:AMP-binding enzyme C-terminal domain-containing protein n=1 Tax=Acrobeloides nanus TaxID=290746 RepID=A0A914CQ92_9BILA
MLVPPILVFLAKNQIVDKYDLSSVEFMMTGGAPVGKDLIEGVYKRLPNIVDIETGQELPRNKVGEVYIRTPSNMLGYLNKPEATAECLSSDNWFKSGDLGYLDDDGWLYIVDRLKELIKVKGLQVAPAELEDLLLSYSDVQDCAVIGVLDEKSGEVPKAFVVKKNPNLTEQQVYDWVKSKLAPYKWLKGGVEFVDEIPKSASGKILRRFLREREKNKETQVASKL